MAITWLAPNLLATWIAIRPAFPVAPRIATRWPRLKSIRRRNATQEDMAGFIAAATAMGSISSGSTTLRSSSITVRSAIVPEGRVVENRVADLPLRVTHNCIDTGYQWQLTRARVVESTRLGAHARVKSRGQDLHDDLSLTLGNGIRELLVAGRLREIGDDCSFHGFPFGSCSASRIPLRAAFVKSALVLDRGPEAVSRSESEYAETPTSDVPANPPRGPPLNVALGADDESGQGQNAPPDRRHPPTTEALGKRAAGRRGPGCAGHR
jgi:hypothetical protein